MSKTTYTTNKRPAYVPYPGEIIADELETRGWTQQQFAEIVGRTPSKVNDIIHGRRAIDLDMAKTLSAAFKGSSPQFWMNLQTSFSLFKSPDSDKEKETSERARVASLINIKELQKRGYIPETKAWEKLKAAILSFLNISSLEETLDYAVSFRTTNCAESEQLNVRTWCKIVEKKAAKLIPTLPPYDPSQFEQCKEELLSLTEKAEDIRKVPQVLSKYGIAFVIEKEFPKTGITGAAFELEQHPVIALSLRYGTIDGFWFTLIHELAHCKDKDYHCDCIEDNEDKANKEAQEWLMPEKIFWDFYKQHKGKGMIKAAEEESRKLRRHPSILLGQLKKRNLLRYNVAAGIHGKASDYLT